MRPGLLGRHAGLALGALLLGLVALAALVSLVWTPCDPYALDLGSRLLAPSPAHPFGTDQLGRDVLSLVMAGARTSLGVAVLAVAFGVAIGAPLGLLGAARPGLVDEVLARANDLLFAFPSLLLAILTSAALGPGAVNAVLAIGVFNVPVFARVVRGAALVEWRRDYVLAARLAGLGRIAISVEHVAPNVQALVVVQGAIQLSLAIIAEAGLSYVGLGTQPPAASWGRMLAEAQTLAGIAPWLALFPGLAILVTVLGLSLLGEGLRDLLDPRLGQDRTLP